MIRKDTLKEGVDRLFIERTLKSWGEEYELSNVIKRMYM